MEYTIKQVSTSKEKDDFLTLPSLIYKDCPQYVPDLRSEVMELLSMQRSSNGHPYAVRAFCAYDAAGNVVGRVVGIINHKANAVWGTLWVPADTPALFMFPEGSHVIEPSRPYMECAVGIHNICSFFSIDWVRRLAYTSQPGTKTNGVRFGLHVTF